MKVLHLPYNIGSKITITVNALRNAGLDAKGIAVNNRLDYAGDNVLVFNPRDYSYLNPKKYFTVIEANKKIRNAIEWSDIIHWYYDYKILRSEGILKYINQINKPSIVEWLGSDIRISEQLSKENPYYKKAFSGSYPYRFETSEHSRTVQKKFKDAGFEALVRPELEEFVQKDIFPSYHKVYNRIDIGKYVPSYPDPQKKNLLIVHPVTSRDAKGTEFILAAVYRLKQKYQFDFLLLENIPHEKVKEKICEADIVIDQLILGAFGTTTLEGLALGKPVVCYVSQSLKKALPLENPIVNANPDTIHQELEKLIVDSTMRNEYGKKSRIYAEKYHDADKIALQLAEIYKKVINKKVFN